ncbi:MAG: PilC/PilY family type IV pilus protein [Burkholderiales bacterium]
MKHSAPPCRALSLALALLLASPTIRAASTDIADVPMAVTTRAAPNIMFVLDDSGSMQWEILPDDVMVAYYVFPRLTTGIYGGTDYSNQVPTTTNNIYNARMRSYHINKLYYNPAVTYRPWANPDGTLWPNANPTCAWHNPANTSKGCRNLTTNLTESADLWVGTGSGGYQTYYPATYFRFDGTPGNSTHENDFSKYTKIEIKSTTPTYIGEGRNNRTDCANAAAATCTYAEEIQNFANWYTYYRSRVLAARAGVGHAFSRLPDTPRVGFGAINKGATPVDGVSTSTVIRGVRPFSGTDRANFFSTLYGHTIPAANTPLRKALDDVGKYFMRTDNAGPWGDNPGSSTSTTPHAYCRQNYTVLMTDGYWNSTGASTATGNVDGTNGPAITGTDVLNNNAAITYQYQAPSGSPPYANPRTVKAAPYSDGWSNTLADVAMYYWNHDLRPDLPNKLRYTSEDEAFWQHMVTYTVGLGVFGSIDPSTCPPPYTATACYSISWPQPSAGGTYQNVDDLFHAAINGHGMFFSAADPTQFAQGLITALNNIVGREGAAAAITVSNPYVTSSDNSAFISGYNSGAWYGELNAYAINLATGLPDLTQPKWSQPAQDQLDAKPWTSRKIATFNGSAGIPFTWSGLGTTLQNRLHSPVSPPGTADGQYVLDFLRGDRTKENTDYRQRTHVLGDIINAEAVYVPPPRANYGDNGYAAFKTAHASRTKMLYQGANDGMLHAFNADTGEELWAYVPGLLLNMNLGTYTGTSSLVNLSRRTGFTHLYYVDATPVSGDVDFSNTSGNLPNPPAPDWRTILVGGLGKGGRGYYALDITNPSANSDADVAAKVLWEFPNAGTPTCSNVNTQDGCRQNIGYSFGTPVIVKTQSRGWVVLVTSGYNNGSDTGGDGQGHLFVLDAKTGALIKDIRTGVGSSSDPSGLAYISAYVQNGDVDATTDYVYGGDLKGNVWRFDLTGNVNSWDVKKLATLVDASGNYQPITTPPELAELATLGKRVVYVGTGRYLGASDIPGTPGANSHASQTQSLYALLDDQSNNPTISPLRSNLVQQTLSVSGSTVTVSPSSVNWNTKKGWFVDFSNTTATTPSTVGQRVIGAPFLALGTLVVSTNVPNTDPCEPGGSSWIYFFDYAFSTSVYGSTLSGSGQFLGNSLASRPTVIMLPNGQPKWLTQQSDQTQQGGSVPVSTSGSAKRRIMWREIVDQ